MWKDRPLALALLALAFAVAAHAVAPALAEEPVMVAPGRLAPECSPITLGTQKELEKTLGKLHESGRDQFLVVGTNVVCGWR